jgi:hypothetical protein
MGTCDGRPTTSGDSFSGFFFLVVGAFLFGFCFGFLAAIAASSLL